MNGDALGDHTLPPRVRATIASRLAHTLDAARADGVCTCACEAVIVDVVFVDDALGGIYAAELRHSTTCPANARRRKQPS